MAVTSLGCNPPLWRFHRRPPILSPHNVHVQPIINPEALRSRSLGT